MSRVDERVLEWLYDKSIAAPPKVIYYNAKEEADLSHTQVKRRCLRLNENGLLYRDPDRGDGYAITGFGRAFVDGEVSKEVMIAVDEYASQGEGYKDRGNVELEDVLEDLEESGILESDD